MASHGVPRIGGPRLMSDQARKKELRKIEQYKLLVDEVNTDVKNDNLSPDVLQKTSKLLQMNPEYYTIWNHRRLILRHLTSDGMGNIVSIEAEKRDKHVEDLISSDLDFLLPLLRQYPKCYWIWNYRSWLLKESTCLLPAPSSRRLWEQDLCLAGKMLTLDSRNFHGWGYRRMLTQALESSELTPGGETGSMVKAEFKYTTKMIGSNLSNFSAWHNRSKLIPRLLDEQQADDNARFKMLDQELELIQRALYTDPSDQSLWFYHQSLMCAFHPTHSGTNVVPNMHNEQRLTYLSRELETLLDMLDGAEDSKWIYQSLLQICAMYREISGNWPSQRPQMSGWLDELLKLDPLRKGRWVDLRRALAL